MSNYRFKLTNHHAIENADIELNGITVISGVNGSGKSTISRWLHYSIGGIVLYDFFAFAEFCEVLIHLLYQYNDLRLPSKDSYIDRTYIDAVSKIKSLEHEENADDHALNIFNQTVAYFELRLKDYIESQPINSPQRSRIFLALEIKEDNVQYSIDKYIYKQYKIASQARETYQNKINSRKKSDYDEFLPKYFKIQEDYPQVLSLKEDNVDLISEKIGWLYGIKDSIYIETPVEVAIESSDNFLWNDFRSQLLVDKKHLMSMDEKKIALRIRKEIGGDIYLHKKITDFELRYKSLDGVLDLQIRQLATGYKTLSYILRLLENGDLTDKTLLIIDEPEAHLHPQWIVEYARILILIHKSLGAKIVINTHNPDFVSAIQSISCKEKIINNITFYIAQVSSESGKFKYINLKQNISEIFKSFNIAFERIKYYGTGQD